MHRIDHSTRLVDANGSGKDGFTEGSPSPLVAATVVTDDWLNDVQENIAQAVEVELTLTKGTLTQLRDMLYAREDKRTLRTFRELPIPASGAVMYGVYDSGTLFVACGASGKLQYSSNGDLYWTEASAGSAYTGTLYDVTKMGSTWCAVGATGGIQTSTNGTSWTARTAAAAFAGTFNSVASNGSLLVAVGTSGTIQSSTDGTTWTARTADGGYTGTFQCIRYDATSASWLATGTDGEVQYSTNGTSWAFVEGSQPTSAYVQCCPHPSGGWIIAKLDTTANLLYIRKSTLASPAGFSAVTNFAATDTSLSRMVVGCDDRRLVIASGDSIRHARIADLTTWTSLDVINTSNLVNGIVYARKSFLAVGAYGSNTWLGRTARHA